MGNYIGVAVDIFSVFDQGFDSLYLYFMMWLNTVGPSSTKEAGSITTHQNLKPAIMIFFNLFLATWEQQYNVWTQHLHIVTFYELLRWNVMLKLKLK